MMGLYRRKTNGATLAMVITIRFYMLLTHVERIKTAMGYGTMVVLVLEHSLFAAKAQLMRYIGHRVFTQKVTNMYRNQWTVIYLFKVLYYYYTLINT